MQQKLRTVIAALVISILAMQCTDKYVPEAPPGTLISVDTSTKKQTAIFPGLPWFDNQRNLINAHAGGVIFDNGFYYWFGTHKLNADEATGQTSGGIHGYKSANLINWDDMGVVMPLSSTPGSDIGPGTRVERSKVVYNASTGKYVALFSIFPAGTGLTIGYMGAATSNTINGPYIYQGKFLGASTAGTGDFALHKDANGDLYHIAVRKSDRALVFAKMSADYLTPAIAPATAAYTVCAGVQISTEAPAIILRNGIYHLLGSGSNGWAPTAPRYYTATTLAGPWTVQANPLTGTNPQNSSTGAALTYGGQSTAIIQVQGFDNRYIAMFDEWRPTAAATSGYIWLPFKINAADKIAISWIDKWDLSWYN